jgi:hypothetical protein
LRERRDGAGGVSAPDTAPLIVQGTRSPTQCTVSPIAVTNGERDLTSLLVGNITVCMTVPRDEGEAILPIHTSGVMNTSAGLDASRIAQLDRDLALTPEARVREADETARLSELAHGDAAPPGPRGFDRYEDFLDWQQFGRLRER